MNVRNAMISSAVAVLLVLSGCSQVDYTPTTDHNTLESVEFAHYVAQQPMVTYDELCRAVLLTADGDEPDRTFDQRDSELKARGIAREAWMFDANHIVDRGTLAYMIFKVTQMSPGVNSTVAGWTGIGCERYALKQATKEQIMAYGLAYQIPTGGEVMQSLSKADDFMVRYGVYQSDETKVTSPADVTGG